VYEQGQKMHVEDFPKGSSLHSVYWVAPPGIEPEIYCSGDEG